MVPDSPKAQYSLVLKNRKKHWPSWAGSPVLRAWFILRHMEHFPSPQVELPKCRTKPETRNAIYVYEKILNLILHNYHVVCEAVSFLFVCAVREPWCRYVKALVPMTLRSVIHENLFNRYLFRCHPSWVQAWASKASWWFLCILQLGNSFKFVFHHLTLASQKHHIIFLNLTFLIKWS